MKFIDKRFMFKGFYMHFAVVDLFYRSGSVSGKTTYPILSIDALKGVGRVGVSLTIPVMAITIGYIKGE